MTAPPLSLYIHLPWCVRKCPYCDFNSHALRGELPHARYVAALQADVQAEAEAGRAQGRRIETIFLGGGTPSLFSGDDIAQILDTVREHFELKPEAEITLEANPGTTERDRLSSYRDAGVNRLSLGAQSFNEDALRRLGRIHGRDEILAAYRDAVAAGFDNVNLDLMYALPGQSVAAALADIEQALALSPAHLSWYQLTLEPNTVFHAKPPQDLPDEDTVWAMQCAGLERLQDAGFERYEISAYARAGHRCQHNLNYWLFGDYLAVGAGAHGKITHADGSVIRYTKPAHPTAYMESVTHAARVSEQTIPATELGFEFMLNALRLPDGFSEETLRSRAGLELAEVVGVQRARELELIGSPRAGWCGPTERGLRYLNDLQALFLP